MATTTESACEIGRLPEELLVASIARTAPRDACRAAAVSPAFRAAADSDAVWACFVPRDLPALAEPAPRSNKALFMRLCDSPVLLADGLTSMWLDRETGAKCYMLSARALTIIWGDTPRYWRWIPITGSSFSEAAELLHVWWLEIRGKMDSKLLSQSTTYAAYFVFKVAPRAYGLASPFPATSVGLGGSESACKVCLDVHGDREPWDDDYSWSTRGIRSRLEIPLDVLVPRRRDYSSRPSRSRLEIPQDVSVPRKRDDGWMEVEMGEFENDEGEDGEVSISFMETSATVKSGLIVLGIEISFARIARLATAARTFPDGIILLRRTQKPGPSLSPIPFPCAAVRCCLACSLFGLNPHPTTFPDGLPRTTMTHRPRGRVIRVCFQHKMTLLPKKEKKRKKDDLAHIQSQSSNRPADMGAFL